MDYLAFALILFGIIVLIMALQYRNSKKSDKLYALKLNKQFGNKDRTSYDEKRLLGASDYYERHRSEWQIDDITWNDLSMDQLFAEMDVAQSDIGSKLLYYHLRTPKLDASEIAEIQNNISFWTDNPNLRNDISVYLSHCGWMKRYSLYDHLDAIKDLPAAKRSKYIRLIICLILSIVSIFLLNGYGILIFLFVFVHNMVIYYREKMKTAPYLALADHICRMIDAGNDIDRILDKEERTGKSEFQYLHREELKQLLCKFSVLKKRMGFLSSMGGQANPMIAFIQLLGSVFFIDLFRFWSIKDWIVKNTASIDKLIEIIGTIDAEICMADYVYANTNRFVRPDFISTPENKIVITDLTHPLIEKPIPNSITMERSILLTGANASGKSTFLKSIALASVMAQTIGYVSAREYRAPILICISSMSLRDDIIQGDSYYMAEIKAVKRMMSCYEKAKEEGLACICFVDELLRGTNTMERIAASTQILKNLDQEGILVCSATHDLELTQLLERFDNYHFEEDLSERDVTFSYKLKTGPALSRNAISLLDRLGFNKTIVENAENMVRRYEETGSWST